MSTAITLLLFALGVVLIVKGGDLFVDAASWMARASGIPPFVIGATIVSLATTLPEIIVSCIAAGQGKTEMAIGNAVGSVSANTGLILSVGILFLPAALPRRSLAPKGALFILALLALWSGARGGSLTLPESVPLLLVFALFILENVLAAKRSGEAPLDERPAAPKGAAGKKLLQFVLGTAGVVIGSQLLVSTGSELARIIGVPENIIGLTAIAIGTSLPELVTTITAVVKRESSLSVGNILGANIIDTALILPICALIGGGSLPVSSQTVLLDIPVCIILAGVILLPAVGVRRLARWQGVLALGIYLSYLAVACL